MASGFDKSNQECWNGSLFVDHSEMTKCNLRLGILVFPFRWQKNQIVILSFITNTEAKDINANETQNWINLDEKIFVSETHKTCIELPITWFTLRQMSRCNYRRSLWSCINILKLIFNSDVKDLTSISCLQENFNLQYDKHNCSLWCWTVVFKDKSY